MTVRSEAPEQEHQILGNWIRFNVTSDIMVNSFYKMHKFILRQPMDMSGVLISTGP